MRRLIDKLESGINTWSIGRKAGWNERAYSDSLANSLATYLSPRIRPTSTTVNRSRAMDSRRPDIVLNVRRFEVQRLYGANDPANEVIVVEVKLDMDSAAEFDRLTDQVSDLLKNKSINRVLVLLLGKTSKKLIAPLAKLEERSRKDDDFITNTRRLRVVYRQF